MPSTKANNSTLEAPPPDASELPKLLVVDDDDELRKQMKWALAENYQVFLAGDRPEALEIFQREQPELVTLDLGLPPNASDPSEGLAILSEVLEQRHGTKVIIISGQEEKHIALKAVERGAADFFVKPIEIAELKIVLQRAKHIQELEAENRRLQAYVAEDSFEGMLGTSPQMEQVFATIRKLSHSDAPVLISGESGTGKELAARAIHQQSRRRNGPFVAINCGAIPETLLESELFGYEKGAFTGADSRKPGRIEAAQGGTLFLDEIGELPQSLQVKLLRFLQDWKIERVGGQQLIEVDCRVLSATNADLEESIRKGAFREDLYYRLAVVTIFMPALREREGDVLLLARYFLQRYASENAKKINGFSRAGEVALQNFSWPGNIRELENRVRRAVIMADSSTLGPVDLGLDAKMAYEGMGLREAREAVERELIERTLTRNRGNITRCAEDLKISRPTLYELMEKLGIERK